MHFLCMDATMSCGEGMIKNKKAQYQLQEQRLKQAEKQYKKD